MGESRSNYSPKYQMKHRLTGAAVIIIVTLSTILLFLREPARMTGSEVPAQMTGSEVPANAGMTENEVFESKLVPLNVSSVNLNEIKGGAAENSPQPPLPETEPDEQRPEKEKKAGQEPGNSSSQADSSPDVPAEPSGGWSVRVGTFTKQENVERLLTFLGDHGLDVKQTRVQIASGEAIRVWLGPYAKRETADATSARLHALRGEKGYVTKHEP